VTKKIGNAVARNRIKRAVRETFRSEAATLHRGASLVVIARDGSARLGTVATAEELAPAMRSIGNAGDGAARGAKRAAPAPR
jgi:ribonuclease P protein component